MNPIKLLQKKICENWVYRKNNVFTENKKSVKHVSYKMQKKSVFTVFFCKFAESCIFNSFPIDVVANVKSTDVYL